MSKQSEKIRVEWKASDEKRDAGLTTPEYVVRNDNLFYGPDKDWQKLDVYRKKGSTGKQPVIVNVHGGGWVYGDKELYQFYCMELVKYGFTVVNFTYRLAPEFKFPASLEDTNLVMEFIIKNAETYGFDTDNVFGVGDSAGGNILGLYSCFLTNEEYRKNFSFKVPKVVGTDGQIKDFKIKGVGLNCGAYWFINKVQPEGKNELMEDLFEKGGTLEELKLIDVMTWVNKDFPPAYIMTGSNDFLCCDALPLANVLMQKQVPFEVKFWHHPEHTCYHVFHVNCRHPLAEECNRLECEFFNRIRNLE